MKKAIAILFACSLLTSCGLLGKVDWPKVVNCGPTAPELFDRVERILLRGEDWKKQLEELRDKYLPSAIVCAVREISQGVIGADAPEAQRTGAQNRAAEFLDEIE
jgi:hypothetical protein